MNGEELSTQLGVDPNNRKVPLWVMRYLMAMKAAREDAGPTKFDLWFCYELMERNLPRFWQSEAGLRIKQSVEDGAFREYVKIHTGRDDAKLDSLDTFLIAARSNLTRVLSNPRFQELASQNPSRVFKRLAVFMESGKEPYMGKGIVLCGLWCHGIRLETLWPLFPPLCFVSDPLGARIMQMDPVNYTKVRQRLGLIRAPFKLLNSWPWQEQKRR